MGGGQPNRCRWSASKCVGARYLHTIGPELFRVFLYPFYPVSCCQSTYDCHNPDRPSSRYPDPRSHCYCRTVQFTGTAHTGVGAITVGAHTRTGPGTVAGLHQIRLAALG